MRSSAIKEGDIHRCRLWWAAWARAPKIGEHPCIYQFLPHFALPKIWVCSPNIFDKSTPVAILRLND